ncbi:hypothetical protein P12x_003944 [Tundrisphaera lichenicola]|uniref:hypothetical protein n=1 Tax=Tundrisphaera lichenicola TaxID=2029860 RepID=UPI003EB92A2A
MQRMLRPALTIGLILLSFSTKAHSSLIRPNDTRAYPDITAFANGFQTYSYNPASNSGVFQLSNVPFWITQGKAADGTFDESGVAPTDDNMKIQTVTAVLDSNGNLIDSPLNNFQLFGKVVVGGQTYSGLLLSGTPTGFGSLSLKPGTSNEDIYDMTLKITGGSMASLYGQDAYIRVTTEANSSFNGVFNSDFSSEKVLTNVHPISSIIPSPIPEPTALVVFLACGAGLFYRGRRRIALQDLEA